MKKSLLALAVASSIISQVQAQTPTANDTVESKLSLATIEVTASPFSQQMGTQKLTAEQIAKTPTGNGTITEFLKNNPNVQFDYSSNLSQAPGELEPEQVSFHGEKYYNNNFMIDGMSNNNNINPAQSVGANSDAPSGYSANDLPSGGAQSFWLNSELIDSVEVFDSNIAAKYGNFTGGVVDAKLKNPDLKRASGSVSYRTTRDSWTKYHIDEKVQADFEQATELSYQPKFVKNFYTLNLNQPLSDKAGLIFSYNRQQSTIPYYQAYLNEWNDQERINETFLLKGSYQADAGDLFTATAIYAPHEAKYYKKDVKNGAFTNEGGGYRFNFEWVRPTDWGKLTSFLGYQMNKNHVTHAADQMTTWFRRYRNQDSAVIDWVSGAGTTNTTAIEGGHGEFATEKRNIVAKQDFAFNPQQFANTEHQFELGWQFDHNNVRYDRFTDTYTNVVYANNWGNVSCATGDNLCIDGEQYVRNRTFRPARHLEGNYHQYAAYFQDNIKWKRLELTPGVRVSYESFLDNVNIEPRFSASLDTFGNGKTKFFTGWNRYYAGSLFAYMLSQDISATERICRGSASASTGNCNATAYTTTWNAQGLKKATLDYNLSDLDTPYSDEINFGVQQEWLNTLWTLKWVNRKSDNQFGRTTMTDSDGQRYYILNNTAKTRGNTVSLAISPLETLKFNWVNIDWSFGANYTKNKSSTQTTYNSSNSNDDSYAIFDGELVRRDELDALNFNTPWTAYFNTNLNFPKINLDWSHRLGYTSGYRGYLTATGTCPAVDSVCGDYAGDVTVYTLTDFDDYVSYDWRLSWKQPTFKNQHFNITLDVNNVFDTVVETNQTSSNARTRVVQYKPGRSFWLGASYHW